MQEEDRVCRRGLGGRESGEEEVQEVYREWRSGDGVRENGWRRDGGGRESGEEEVPEEDRGGEVLE